MMGRTHYATGICAGAYCAWMLRWLLALLLPEAAALNGWVAAVVAGALTITWVSGRAAYWPDLDHAGSVAAHKAGWITGVLSVVVSRISCDVYDATATETDKQRGNFRDHRGVTHFLVTALVIGALWGIVVWQVTEAAPRVTWSVTAGAVTAWACSEAYRWARLVKAPRDVKRLARVLARLYPLFGFAVGVLAWFALPVPPGLDTTTLGWVLGLGMGLSILSGMLAHDLGDAATKTGVPLFWPVKIQGQRYFPVHIRKAENLTKTSAKSPTEARVRRWSWVLAAVAVVGWIPGLYLLIVIRVLDLLARLTSMG